MSDLKISSSKQRFTIEITEEAYQNLTSQILVLEKGLQNSSDREMINAVQELKNALVITT